MCHQDFLLFVQDRTPLVEFTEIPEELLKKKDAKDADYPMDGEEAKAEFLKAGWAGFEKKKCVWHGLQCATKTGNHLAVLSNTAVNMSTSCTARHNKHCEKWTKNVKLNLKILTSIMQKRLNKMKGMVNQRKAKEGAEVEVRAKDEEKERKQLKERAKEKPKERDKNATIAKKSTLHLPQLLQLRPIQTARNLLMMLTLQSMVRKLWKLLLSPGRSNLIHLLPVRRSRRPVLGQRQLPVLKWMAQDPGEGRFLKERSRWLQRNQSRQKKIPEKMILLKLPRFCWPYLTCWSSWWCSCWKHGLAFVCWVYLQLLFFALHPNPAIVQSLSMSCQAESSEKKDEKDEEPKESHEAEDKNNVEKKKRKAPPAKDAETLKKACSYHHNFVGQAFFRKTTAFIIYIYCSHHNCQILLCGPTVLDSCWVFVVTLISGQAGQLERADGKACWWSAGYSAKWSRAWCA